MNVRSNLSAPPATETEARIHTKSAEDFDVMVLGAGMVGISVAVQLQRRGLSVGLVDRGSPGRETSFGNAGLIQSEAVLPYLFPRSIKELAGYAFSRSPSSSYHLRAMPGLIAPFARYWKYSSPKQARRIAGARAPLILRSGADHRELAELAAAEMLLRPTGWTNVYGNEADLDLAWVAAQDLTREFGVSARRLDAQALMLHEPGLREGLVGAIHYPEPLSVRDPIDLSQAYTTLFQTLGGRVRIADARSLSWDRNAWRVENDGGRLRAPRIVIALGPWATEITAGLGYRPPLFAQRGYHMHFASAPHSRPLNRPLLDASGGYVISPMKSGIRLTTGAEFAMRDAAPTPVQLKRTEPLARELFPTLGHRLDEDPWLGSRPCLPDMLPVIGPLPGRDDVWMAFGHGHQGFTLGPTTGRLLAEMMMGDRPSTDPVPYRADRF